MKNEDEDVAKLAVEFWSTVCEEEIAIEDDNAGVSSQSATGTWKLLTEHSLIQLK
jgi:importin subunit beta-1